MLKAEILEPQLLKSLKINNFYKKSTSVRCAFFIFNFCCASYY